MPRNPQHGLGKWFSGLSSLASVWDTLETLTCPAAANNHCNLGRLLFFHSCLRPTGSSSLPRNLPALFRCELMKCGARQCVVADAAGGVRYTPLYPRLRRYSRPSVQNSFDRLAFSRNSVEIPRVYMIHQSQAIGKVPSCSETTCAADTSILLFCRFPGHRREEFHIAGKGFCLRVSPQIAVLSSDLRKF